MKDLDLSRAKGRDNSKVETNQVPAQTKDPLYHKKKRIQKTMFSLYLEDKVKLEKMVNDLSLELQWEGIKADRSKLIRILIDRAFVNFENIRGEIIEQMKSIVKEITLLSTQRNTASRARNMDGLL